MKEYGIKTFTWETLRYEEGEINKQTRLGIGVNIGILILISLYYRVYTLSVLLIFWSLMMIYVKHHETENITVEINVNGIKIDDTITEFSKIKYFYIDEMKNQVLYRTKGVFGSVLIIQIDEEIDIPSLRNFLLGHIPEKQIKLSTTDKLINTF